MAGSKPTPSSLPGPSVLRNLIFDYFKEPVLFTGLIDDWEMISWSLDDWVEKMGKKKFPFRVGLNTSKEPQWEANCATISITMQQFVEESSLPLSQRNRWLYFDYKHMFEWFQDNPDILEAVTWKNFGFPERKGAESTLWISSEGAHTPCHLDSYGCNLVAQICGRKQWILVSPAETTSMLPTRVPYEESSIYSSWNFNNPDPAMASVLKDVRVVTLLPGEVLFVPRHWWHYVETLDTAISVNTWIPLPGDGVCRLEESLVRLFICQLCKDIQNPETILNPNEMDLLNSPLSVSTHLVMSSLQECSQLSKDSHLNTHKRIKLDNDQEDKNNAQELDVEHCNNISTSNAQDKCLEALDYIKTPNRFIRFVPRCLESEFFGILTRKSNSFNTCPSPDDIVSPANRTPDNLLQKIVNAFCHPDVIALVRQKLET